jgi:hypothetical protein
MDQMQSRVANMLASIERSLRRSSALVQYAEMVIAAAKELRVGSSLAAVLQQH